MQGRRVCRALARMAAFFQEAALGDAPQAEPKGRLREYAYYLKKGRNGDSGTTVVRHGETAVWSPDARPSARADCPAYCISDTFGTEFTFGGREGDCRVCIKSVSDIFGQRV